MQTLIERGCGLDVHQATVVACLLIVLKNGKVQKQIRTFGTTTRELLALREWLLSEGCTHVAMESTGCTGSRSRRPPRTTPIDGTEAQTFLVTHPFHPLTGRQFATAGFCRYGPEDRVCFHDEQDRICEIPLNWTNLAPEDPFVILSAGKSWFRFEDLRELARLMREVQGHV
jgi:hypothetical protein